MCKSGNIGATLVPSSLTWVRAENSLSECLKTTSDRGNGGYTKGQSVSAGQMNRQASSSGGSNPDLVITTCCAALTKAKPPLSACGLFAS